MVTASRPLGSVEEEEEEDAACVCVWGGKVGRDSKRVFDDVPEGRNHL